MSDEVRSAPELFPTAVNCLSDNLPFVCFSFLLFSFSFSLLDSCNFFFYNFTIAELFKIEYFVQDATTTKISLKLSDKMAGLLVCSNSVSIVAIDSLQV